MSLKVNLSPPCCSKQAPKAPFWEVCPQTLAVWPIPVPIGTQEAAKVLQALHSFNWQLSRSDTLLHTVKHQNNSNQMLCCEVTPQMSERSVVMQRQATASQIIHVSHYYNKAVLTPHANCSVCSVKPCATYHVHQCIARTGSVTLAQPSRFPFERTKHDRNCRQCTCLPHNLHRGLTLKKGVWLVINDDHHFLSALQMAPPLL